MGSGSLHDESLSGDDAKVYPEMDDFSSYDLKFSKVLSVTTMTPAKDASQPKQVEDLMRAKPMEVE